MRSIAMLKTVEAFVHFWAEDHHHCLHKEHTAFWRKAEIATGHEAICSHLSCRGCHGHQAPHARQGLFHGITEVMLGRGCYRASVTRELCYAGAAPGQRHGQQRCQRSSRGLGSQQPVREPPQQAGPRPSRPCLRGHCQRVPCRQHCACPPWGLCPNQVGISMDGPTSRQSLCPARQVQGATASTAVV